MGPHTESGPPSIFTVSRHVSIPKPDFDHYIVVGRTLLLPPEENRENYARQLKLSIKQYQSCTTPKIHRETIQFKQ